jgi:hypothetical protein
VEKIKVKCFASFCSDVQIHRNMLTAWDIPTGRHNNLEFTSDNDFTHAVIFNWTKPDLRGIPPENVIGFSQEPKPLTQFSGEFLDWAVEHVGTYFVDDNSQLPENFVEGHLFITPKLCWKTKDDLFPKTRKMSLIASEKRFLEGHDFRHRLIEAILQTDLPVDIYGRTTERYHDSLGRVKGPFATTEPWNGYEYAISIENTRNQHYYSEKFTTCLESRTFPIYYGADKVQEWYGDDCCVPLVNTNIDEALDCIMDVFNHPRKVEDEHKNKLYEEYYFPEFLRKFYECPSHGL